ncbi:unnamed protein product [Strongylus vulgaris]|uniref:Uncharacterized protein n=1 Tax=Strongylus vulgaris TaxID=40348 RepID=A0A3P7JAA9_STRVU|nr:unnamed protein product [Strongylus vulgaris]
MDRSPHNTSVKINASIQRKVLQHHITPGMQEESRHMKDIITALDNCISKEERISEMMTNTGTDKAATYLRKTRIRGNDNSAAPCLLCNGTNHRTATCDKQLRNTKAKVFPTVW